MSFLILIFVCVVAFYLLKILLPMVFLLVLFVFYWVRGILAICKDFPIWLFRLFTGEAKFTLIKTSWLESLWGLLLIILACAAMLLAIGLVLVLPWNGIDDFINYMDNVYMIVGIFGFSITVLCGGFFILAYPAIYMMDKDKKTSPPPKQDHITETKTRVNDDHKYSDLSGITSNDDYLSPDQDLIDSLSAEEYSDYADELGDFEYDYDNESNR